MGKTLHRTQVLLEDWQYQYLRQLSSQTNRSVSSILREWVAESIQSRTQEPVSQDPFFDIIGMVGGDGTPVGRHHDRYLYDNDKGNAP